MATAGHVDHGKSTLIRALTGMEPDRWEEERRRGLTIDLGFAWTTLPSGREVAFVDVPGHQRFLANTLAGLGPAPVVCFVVAADEGWQAQSSDHRDALAALGIRHGLIVISRADRAPDHAGAVLAQARDELAGAGLRDAPGVIVSAVAGTGLTELRATLDRVLGQLPGPETTARVRLWVDRSFTITGAGTVVTGTLAAGTVARGDRLDVLGADQPQSVVIRGLQSRGEPYPTLGPVARVALNLRGVPRDVVRRGHALVTPGAWPSTGTLDVRRTSGGPLTEAAAHLVVHVGTAAVPARLRPFDDDHGRLTLDRRLPLVLGDRLVLRDPGGQRVLGGALVLDADPPVLRRRGDGTRRAAALSAMNAAGDVGAEVARRGAVRESHLRRLGLLASATGPPEGVRVLDDWWVHDATYDAWRQRLRAAVEELHTRDPLAEGLSRGAARDLLALPDESLLDAVARDAGLERHGGHIRVAGAGDDLGCAEAAVSELEARLRAQPFHAPEADDLSALKLTGRELAAAERVGRVLRLRDGVVLLPTAPALAMRELARLDQPFTTSQARQALGTTRRVVIPLLEHLDSRGWTRRLDAGHREVVR
ncbi:selenocysteine-specific translation elongation factor [Mycobacterium florentinum]|uniref:selenocysteine-specific translation elongation factor n=1 Tax=Mycobacterium florentinum TaxID=292462 RepID=UPI00111C6C1D|nr:selenocysteine-specific translation elongation factor [Mycobacterium florentinum]MCV7410296.1 selenocysteine-specific translation elongation factor [Mycobacterium florentinum]BBX79610.1 selenocysteine-specific translation elongation factor [Mycobacterium florentinum]